MDTARRDWALQAAAAAAGLALARAAAPGVVADRAPLLAACGVIAACGVAGALGGARARRVAAPVLASARLALVLLASLVWRGEARELWGALAVWVAWRDADAGLSRARPLLPAAVAIVAALAWSAHAPGPPSARAGLVALVAAAAAARAHRGRGSAHGGGGRE